MWIGMVFLLPIIIVEIRRNWRTSWKMMLTVFSIIPWWIIATVITHNPIYLWSHYIATTWIWSYFNSLTTFSGYASLFIQQAIPIFIALFILILLKFPKHLEYAAYILIAVAYEWGNTLEVTYLPAMIFSVALVMPLVSYEYNLIERGKKWLGLDTKDIIEVK